jgi:dolichol-phosphate mannosyltransferase
VTRPHVITGARLLRPVKCAALSALPAERLLVVIPTYNERENLASLLAEARRVLPEADLLVIDDASPDGTGELADALAGRDPRMRVLHRPAKLGLGTAYLEGFRLALHDGYDYVFEMDADFSHAPSDLVRLLEAARAGADLAIGSRYVPGGGTRNWGLGRRLISRGGSLYARAILGVPVRDLTSGFKCFRRAALESLDLSALRSEGYAFQIEVTYRLFRRGRRVVELPIVFVDRRVGSSKMSRRILVEAVGVVWKLRFTA